MNLPPELRDRAVSLDDLVAAGVPKRQLGGSKWRRWGPRTYAPANVLPSAERVLCSVLHRLPRGSVFSGATAAWSEGQDYEPCSPIEVTVPDGIGVWSRAGLVVRRATLTDDERTDRDGLPFTSPVRTAADLGRRVPFVEAVVALDSSLHLGLTTHAEIERWARRHPGHRGVRRLRQALELSDPAAESPMETRLRVLLMQAGLPRPESQVELSDDAGIVVARVDFFYPRANLAIEYDGDVHRERLREDMQRQNQLLATGVRLLRFTSADVYGNPAAAVAQVAAALASPK